MNNDDLLALAKRLRALGNELQQAAADIDGAGLDGLQSAREMALAVEEKLAALRVDMHA